MGIHMTELPVRSERNHMEHMSKLEKPFLPESKAFLKWQLLLFLKHSKIKDFKKILKTTLAFLP